MDGDGSTQEVALEPLSLAEAQKIDANDATLALRKRLDFWIQDSPKGDFARLLSEGRLDELGQLLAAESAVLGVLLGKARFVEMITNVDIPGSIKFSVAAVILRLDECCRLYAAQTARPEAKEIEPEQPPLRAFGSIRTGLVARERSC